MRIGVQLVFFIVLGIALTLLQSCSEDNKAQAEESSYKIQPQCLGDICLGSNISELLERENIIKRLDLFEYSNGIADSVVFIEQHRKEDVIASSRIPLNDYESNGTINYVSTNSSTLQSDYGLRIGLKEEEVEQIVLNSPWKKWYKGRLSEDQILLLVSTPTMKNSILGIKFETNYDEQGNESDKTVSSIFLKND